MTLFCTIVLLIAAQFCWLIAGLNYYDKQDYRIRTLTISQWCAMMLVMFGLLGVGVIVVRLTARFTVRFPNHVLEHFLMKNYHAGQNR